MAAVEQLPHGDAVSSGFNNRSSTYLSGGKVSQVTQREVEVSLGWAWSYPNEFHRTFRNWVDECRADGLLNCSVDIKREGFVTFRAIEQV